MADPLMKGGRKMENRKIQDQLRKRKIVLVAFWQLFLNDYEWMNEMQDQIPQNF